MPYSAARINKRKAAGMCIRCDQPNNGTSQMCADHRRQDTVAHRKRHRAKVNAFSDGRRCGLCRGPGHNYRTCPANPEAKN